MVVVASEGLKDESGKPVVPPIFQTGRSVYYGDVGAYLAELVIKNLETGSGLRISSLPAGLPSEPWFWQKHVTIRELFWMIS